MRIELRDVAPVPEHRARARRVQAGQDLGQRRLARAVLAHQRDHLALRELERDVVQGGLAAARIGEAHVAGADRVKALGHGLVAARGGHLREQRHEAREIGDEQRALIQRARGQREPLELGAEQQDPSGGGAGPGQRQPPVGDEGDDQPQSAADEQRGQRGARDRLEGAPAHHVAQRGDALLVEVGEAPRQEAAGVVGADLLGLVLVGQDHLQVQAPAVALGLLEGVAVHRLAGGDGGQPDRDERDDAR